MSYYNGDDDHDEAVRFAAAAVLMIVLTGLALAVLL